MKEIDQCYGCGGCVAVCPFQAIEMDEQARIDPEKCQECKLCELVCPENLIDIDKMMNSTDQE